MVRRTKEEAQETREAILVSAAKVFVENGVAKASLEEIARDAGVTRGAVYWHFKNKADIFAALHDQLYMSFSEMILHDLEVDNPHPLEQLRDLTHELFLDLERNPQKKRVLTVFFLKCDYSGDMAPFLAYQQEQRFNSMQLFSQFFKRAIEKGDLPSESDPCILTRSFVCFITGVAIEYLRYPELLSLDEHVPHMINGFFKGLLGCQAAKNDTKA